MSFCHRLASVLLTPLLAAMLLSCSSQPAPPPPATPPAASSDTAVVGLPHRAHWEVDGETFRIESGQVTTARIPAIGNSGTDHIVIELRSPDESARLKLELFVASGASVEGEFSLVPIRGPALETAAGQGNLLLIASTDAGRSTLLAGEGLVLFEQEDEDLVATFSFVGDGRFRAADAAPVSGELRIRRPLTRL